MWLIFGMLFVECFLGTSISTVLNANSQINENIAIVIVLINILFSIFIIYKMSKGNKDIFFIITFALVIRVVMMFFDLYGKHIFVLPNSGRDSEKFNNYAQLFPNIDLLKDPYPFFIGFIYSFFFYSRIVAQYTNVLFSLFTTIIVLKILEEFNISYKAKVISIFIISFLPNYIIMSSILLRESMNIFLLAISLLFFVKWWKYNKFSSFVYALIFSLISALLHSGVIANTLGYIIIFILYNNKERKAKIAFKSLVFIGTFLGITMVFMSSPDNPIMAKFKGIEDVNTLVGKTAAYDDGGSAYGMSTDINTTFDLLINSPMRMIYFLASPLPWMWRGANDIIAFMFSGVFYIGTFGLAVYYSRKKSAMTNRNFINISIILCILGAFIFAWGTANAGTALRHRDKFIVDYIVMLAVVLDGIYRSKKRKMITDEEKEYDAA